MNNTRKHPWILQALCQYAGMLPPFPLLSGTAGDDSSGFLRPVSALNESHAMIPNFINNVQLLGKMTRTETTHLLCAQGAVMASQCEGFRAPLSAEHLEGLFCSSPPVGAGHIGLVQLISQVSANPLALALTLVAPR